MKPQELIEKIQSDFQSARHSKFGNIVDGLLPFFSVDLYSSPFHFILELLQNAVDVNSKRVNFIYSRTGLIFENDGYLFRESDVINICDITRSEKTNKIGYKGIGFKSVATIFDKVEIYSGEFAFSFDKKRSAEPNLWIIYPFSIDENSSTVDRSKTTISLSFEDPSSKIVQNLSDEISKISSEVLLFLDRLEEISFLNQVSGTRQKWSKQRKRMLPNEEIFFETVMPSGSAEQPKSWITFSGRYDTVQADEKVRTDYFQRKLSRVRVPKEVHITIAIRGNNEESSLLPEEGKIFAYFPTQERTGLRFSINADLIPTTSRESLVAESDWNRWVLEKASECVIRLLELMKQEETLRKDILEIVPAKNELIGEYTVFEKKIHSHLLASNSILTDSGGWENPQQVIVADSELIELIPSPEFLFLTKLCYANRAYLSTLKDRTRKMLAELGVKELDKNSLFALLKEEAWLESKSPAWHAQLFAYLGKQRLSAEDFELLKEQRIVIDRNKKLRLPSDVFSSRNVKKIYRPYLRKLRSEFYLIHPQLMQNDSSRQFLTSADRLGVRSASPREIIQKILLKKLIDDPNIAEDDLLRITEFIKVFLERETDEKTSDGLPFKTIIGKTLPVICEDGKRRRPNEAVLYLPNEYGTRLSDLFQGLPISFVSPIYLESQHDDLSWREFFSAISVWDKPKLNEVSERVIVNRFKNPHGNLAWWEEYWNSVLFPNHEYRTSPVYPETIKNSASIDMIENVFDFGDNEQRMRILLELINENYDYYQKALTAEYHWKYFSDYQSIVPSYLTFVIQKIGIASSSGLKNPRQVYKDNDENRRFLGDSVPYLDKLLDIKEELLEKLGVHSKLGEEGLILALERQRKKKDVDLDLVVGIYSRLSKLQPYRIASLLSKLPEPIFFEQEWWSAPYCFLSSEPKRLFGAERAYLSEIYFPETNSLFSIMDVKTTFVGKDLIDFLREISQRDQKVSSRLLRSIYNIYKELNEEVAEGKIDWIAEFQKLNILSEEGKFVPLDTMYVRDDENYYSYFFDKIPFANLPPLIDINSLLENTKMKRLSDHVLEEVVQAPEIRDISTETRAKSLLKANLPYIKTILNAKADKLDHSRLDALFDNVITCEGIRIIYKISDNGSVQTPQIERACYFDRKNEKLLVTKKFSYLDLAWAISSMYHTESDLVSPIALLLATADDKKRDLLRVLNLPMITDQQEEESQYETPAKETAMTATVGSGEASKSVLEGIKVTTGSSEVIEPSERSEIEVVDERDFSSVESADSVASLESEVDRKQIDLGNIYRPARDVFGPIRTLPKEIVYTDKKFIRGLDLNVIKVGSEIILAKPGSHLPEESKLLDFSVLLRKIVGCMGGNPDTVKVMVTDLVTEAREIDDQLYFNYALSDMSPIFWILIAARELAGLQYKNNHYAFVKAMSALVERGIENLSDIYPEFFMGRQRF